MHRQSLSPERAKKNKNITGQDYSPGHHSIVP